MAASVTHVAYSDETNYNRGRFRGVAAVSATLGEAIRVEEKIRDLLTESNVRELAWKDLRSAKHRFAAEKVCRYIIGRAAPRTLRVDALLWDTYGPRHAVIGRDDLANLGRMYHHLFVTLLVRRWPDEAVWALYPDEFSGLDWQAVGYFLQGKALHGKRVEGELFRRLTHAFRLETLTPVRSGDHPLVQVADLLVGLAVFSRTDYEGFATWQQSSSPQSTLLESREPTSPSSAQEARYSVLDCFNAECKSARLGVSLRQRRYLWTPNPHRPINFWWWESQTPMDKAPRRLSRN